MDVGSTTVVCTAVEADNFTILAAALHATGLDQVLADDSRQFTVFAPTDDVFALLRDETIRQLLANPDALSTILLYHVLAGQAVDSATAISLAGGTVAKANDLDISLSLRVGSLFINDSRVITTDIRQPTG